ncbi:uncharacterized protein EV154DRAFT_484032 [Mucor mucedo]|uniref:uncharacterized protein n=1 Tax=Mucor mucedo TaxID=29922 RepID=UPI0022206B40|nr:uncharacterized protein EV154DRAFT_484032 [Mucor mucedo]KAI7888561.1 hypothetical protein EV154DRAFT_484032 [Mucor mucedo]
MSKFVKPFVYLCLSIYLFPPVILKPFGSNYRRISLSACKKIFGSWIYFIKWVCFLIVHLISNHTIVINDTFPKLLEVCGLLLNDGKSCQTIRCLRYSDMNKDQHHDELRLDQKRPEPEQIRTESQTFVVTDLNNIDTKTEQDDKAFITLRQVTSSRRVTIKREPLDQDSKDLLSGSVEEKSIESLKCNQCRLCFINLEHLNMHMEPCHGVNDYKVLASPRKLNLFCHSCQITFIGRKGYSRHLKTTHLVTSQVPAQYTPNRDLPPIIDERTLYCNICRKTYKSIPIYRTHMKRIHKMGKKPIKRKPGDHSCNICGRLFASKLVRTSHCKIAHYGFRFNPRFRA